MTFNSPSRGILLTNFPCFLCCAAGTIRNDIIPQCVTPFAPDAILIFWDSDVSDVSESDMSADEVFALRDKYETNLFGALDTLMQTGAYLCP